MATFYTTLEDMGGRSNMVVVDVAIDFTPTEDESGVDIHGVEVTDIHFARGHFRKVPSMNRQRFPKLFGSLDRLANAIVRGRQGEFAERCWDHHRGHWYG